MNVSNHICVPVSKLSMVDIQTGVSNLALQHAARERKSLRELVQNQYPNMAVNSVKGQQRKRNLVICERVVSEPSDFPSVISLISPPLAYLPTVLILSGHNSITVHLYFYS